MPKIIITHPIPVVIDRGIIYAHGLKAGFIIQDPEEKGCFINLHGAITVGLKNRGCVNRWLRRHIQEYFPTIREWALSHRGGK